MANHFRGESVNTRVTVDWKDISFLGKIMVILCVVLFFVFIGLLFVPGMGKAGIAGLIAWFIFLSLTCIYVGKLQGRQRIAPYILIAAGILGETGYLLVSAYVEKNGFTIGLLVLICCTVIFAGFFIPGICILAAGIKRNRKWKTYSRTVMAAIVSYKNITTGMFEFDNIAPGLNNPVNNNTVYSPVIQYDVDGKTYTGETGSYFGRNQLPAVGQQIEIHVNPANPNDFIMVLQKGSFFIVFGLIFVVIGLVALFIAASIAVLVKMIMP